MPLRISAILCTFNRAAYLRKAIASLATQTLPAEDYEIIVVDNGSTDDTARVVKEQFKDVSNLCYVHEPVKGLSQARNTGARQARSEIVAYLDDDGIADPKWLESALEDFDHHTPAPDAVGGAIDLIWEAPRPDWLPDGLLHLLGYTHHAPQRFVIKPGGVCLPGGNMAIRRKALDAVGGYNTALGRKGSRSLLSNEELELQRKMDQRGMIRLYDPRFCMGHHVSAERVRKNWYTRRLYWQGVSDGLQELIEKPLTQWWRLRLGARQMRVELCRWRNLRLLMSDPADASMFNDKCWLLHRVGRAKAYLDLRMRTP